jgi:hypothetical protein
MNADVVANLPKKRGRGRPPKYTEEQLQEQQASMQAIKSKK